MPSQVQSHIDMINAPLTETFTFTCILANTFKNENTKNKEMYSKPAANTGIQQELNYEHWNKCNLFVVWNNANSLVSELALRALPSVSNVFWYIWFWSRLPLSSGSTVVFSQRQFSSFFMNMNNSFQMCLSVHARLSACKCVLACLHLCVYMCVCVLLQCGWQELISDYGCKLAEWLSLIIANKTMALLSVPSLPLLAHCGRLDERERERERERWADRERERGPLQSVPENKRFHFNQDTLIQHTHTAQS